MNEKFDPEYLKKRIRWIVLRDMPEILGIESVCFEFPWKEQDFVECLKQRCSIGMAVEHNDSVVAYMIYELGKSWIRLLNFAVSPEFEGCGIGSAMVDKLYSKLSEQRRTKIVVQVRESNLDALLFFRSQGFFAIGVLRGVYEDCDDDTIEMERHLVCSKEPAIA